MNDSRFSYNTTNNGIFFKDIHKRVWRSDVCAILSRNRKRVDNEQPRSLPCNAVDDNFAPQQMVKKIGEVADRVANYRNNTKFTSILEIFFFKFVNLLKFNLQRNVMRKWFQR